MFQSPLVLEASPQPDLWIVRAPLIWEGKDGRIEVPVGFITDLASVPRFLCNLPDFDPNGISRRPGTLHDWLYGEQSRPKSYADALLREAMIVEGASSWVADAYFEAVNRFGSIAWNNNAGKLQTKFDTRASYLNYLQASH